MLNNNNNQQSTIENNTQQCLISLPSLNNLLQYQQKFIKILHTDLYKQNNKQQKSTQIIIHFQLQHISILTDNFTIMLKQLSVNLLDQKKIYQNNLRDNFHKILMSDYLPLIRFSKYQLFQVSLYGFDIYIQPLEAILSIINRIDNSKQLLIQSLNNYKQSFQNFQEKLQFYKSQIPLTTTDALNILQNNWGNYLILLNLYRISLNVYLLKQYLIVASKSLSRKDKQLIFTGINNIFKNLIGQILVKYQIIWLLSQFAQLNNQLYGLHPNYDIIHFYTYFNPVKDSFQCVFNKLQIIAMKCAATNILTPLLFALLRNHESISLWINTIQNNIWQKYLNVLFIGLIFNMKARILQFQQIIIIFKKVTSKMALLRCCPQINLIGKDLDKQWKQAKDYFRSALKLGYNVGEFHTWHLCSAQHIQQQVSKILISSLLLLPNSPEVKNYLLQFSLSPKQYLEQIIQKITNRRLSLQHIKTTQSSSQIKLQSQIQNQKLLLWFIRVINLIHFIKQQISNQQLLNLLYWIIDSLLINYIDNKDINKLTQLQSKRLNQLIINDLINLLINNTKLIQHINNKSQKLLIKLYKNYPQQKLFKQLIKILFKKKNPKQNLPIILLQLQNNNIQQILNYIIYYYFSKRSNKRQKNILIKTFQKQFKIQSQCVNLLQQQRLCLSVLVQMLINNSYGGISQLIISIVKVIPEIVLPLLMFPISNAQGVEIFSRYLLMNPHLHTFLLAILKQSFNVVYTDENQDYNATITIPSLCNDVITYINNTISTGIGQKAISTKPYLQLLQKLYNLLKYKSKDKYQDILWCYKLIIKQLAIQGNNDYYPILKETLQSYLRILSKNIIGKDCWLEFYYTIAKYNAIHNGERDKIDNTQLHSIQPIKNISSVFYIEDNHQYTDSQTSYTYQQIQSILQSKKQQNPEYVNQEKFIPQWCQNLAAQDLYKLNLNENINWKQKILKYKSYIPPQISSDTVYQILSQKIQLNKNLLTALLLNPHNLLSCLIWSLDNKDVKLINKIGYIKMINPYFDKLCGFILQIQNKQQFLKNLIINLTNEDKQIISFSYILKQQHILIFQQYNQLQFLIVDNPINWRILLDNINNKLQNMNINSILLQYQQYLQITNSLNLEYTTYLNNYINIFKLYSKYLKYRNIIIQNNIQKKQQQQINLLIINQIANAKIIISSGKVKQVLIRLGYFNKYLILRNMQPFLNIIQYFHYINLSINKLIKSNIMIPDFLYSHCYQNNIIDKNYQFSLGQYLQDYQSILNLDHQQELKNYQQYQHIPKCKFINLQKFKQINQYEQTIKLQITDKNIVEKYFEDILNELIEQNVLKNSNNVIDVSNFNHKEQFQQIYIQKDTQKQQKSPKTDTQSNSSMSTLQISKLYKLGIMYPYNSNKYKLSILLQQCVNRKKLTWQLLKENYGEIYHHIKSIIMNKEIRQQQLFFEFRGKQLIQKGKQRQVTQGNKYSYCNKLGLLCLGKEKMLGVQAFVQGVLNSLEGSL